MKKSKVVSLDVSNVIWENVFVISCLNSYVLFTVCNLVIGVRLCSTVTSSLLRVCEFLQLNLVLMERNEVALFMFYCYHINIFFR
jgi:hypothetical protein